MTNAEKACETLALISAYKFEAVRPFVHDDIITECAFPAFHQGPLRRGKEAFVQALHFIPHVFKRFQNIIHKVYDCPAQDTVVIESTSFGIFAANEKIYQNRYILIFGFRDGRIVLWREFFNPEIMNNAMAFMAEPFSPTGTQQ